MSPFNCLPLIILGLILWRTLRRKTWTYSTNSGLNSSIGMLIRFYSASSFVRGRIMVTQSRSEKKLFRRRLILFFWSTDSEKPFWDERAFSRYSLAFIESPSESTNCKVKSRTTHMKDGKYLAKSYGSMSSLLMPELLIWICFVKFTTRFRF